jgi:hypothetical protein
MTQLLLQQSELKTQPWKLARQPITQWLPMPVQLSPGQQSTILLQDAFWAAQLFFWHVQVF